MIFYTRANTMQYWLDTLQNTLFILSKYNMYIALDIKRDEDNSGLLKSIYVTKKVFT